jgi:DUF2946 family protein
MRWFRDHIRRGSWIGLVALAINIGLSFGHIHAVNANGLGHLSASQIAGNPSTGEGGNQGHHDDDRIDLLCPICVAAGALAHAMAATPPALPPLLVEPSVDLALELVSADPQPLRTAFDPRGPPVS